MMNKTVAHIIDIKVTHMSHQICPYMISNHKSCLGKAWVILDEEMNFSCFEIKLLFDA